MGIKDNIDKIVLISFIIILIIGLISVPVVETYAKIECAKYGYNSHIVLGLSNIRCYNTIPLDEMKSLEELK